MQIPHSGWVVLGMVVLALAGFGFWYVYGPQSTISVTGTSTVTAAPDQFVFNPSYQVEADKSEDAISEVSTIGNAAVAKLKELGVADSDLTTNVNSNQNYKYDVAPAPQPSGFLATFSITATAKDKDLSKKIVDYLATTPVQGGSVTPSSSFSTAKKAELENDARTKALTDARSKADVTAKTLGVRLLGVKSVKETSPFSDRPIYALDASSSSKPVTSIAPTFETADQDYTFTVSVEYRIR